jgi:hypothetical protein
MVVTHSLVAAEALTVYTSRLLVTITLQEFSEHVEMKTYNHGRQGPPKQIRGRGRAAKAVAYQPTGAEGSRCGS